MITGSKEWIDENAKEYRQYLEVWAKVRWENGNGDYTNGQATINGNGDYTIITENGNKNYLYIENK